MHLFVTTLLLIANEAPSSQPASAPVVQTPPGTSLRAAFGKGVTFSTGEMFELDLRARVQVRFRHLEPGIGSSANRLDEFSIRRARIQLQGKFLRDFDFRMQLGLASSDMERDLPNPLRDAQISYTRLRDLSIRVGQGKVQFDRHRMTSSSALIFPERALVMSELTLDRDVGFELFSANLFGLGGRLGYAFGVWGGDGRNRFAPNAGLLYSLRLEWNPFGSFDTRKEGDVERERRPRLQIAVAGARNNGTVRTLSTSGGFYRLGGFDYWHATADVTFKWRGFYLLLEWLYRSSPLPSRSGVVDGSTVTEWSRSATGGFAQASMMLVYGLEAGARYGYLHPLANTDPSLQRQHEIGGVVSYYLFGHDLKLNTEYVFVANTRFVGDHQVRVQTQLFF